MATVHISVGDVNSRGDTGMSMPVRKSQAKYSQTMTSTGSSAASTITAVQALDDFWSITAKGGDIYAAFGLTPNAAADPRELILDGQTRDFSATEAGEKVAIKDV